jgi:hypothetical protein
MFAAVIEIQGKAQLLLIAVPLTYRKNSIIVDYSAFDIQGNAQLLLIRTYP